MSSSSGFALLERAATVRGSRAMPQIGQAPGFVSSTSGSIGQTHSTAGAGAPAACRRTPRGWRRPRPHRRRRRSLREPVLGVRGEALAAAGVAEPVGPARVLVRAAASRGRVHLHPAHRVGLRLDPGQADAVRAASSATESPFRSQYRPTSRHLLAWACDVAYQAAASAAARGRACLSAARSPSARAAAQKIEQRCPPASGTASGSSGCPTAR